MGGPYLYARPGFLLAQAADQSPSVAGDVGHVGDRLHLLWVPDAHLHGTFDMLDKHITRRALLR